MSSEAGDDTRGPDLAAAMSEARDGLRLRAYEWAAEQDPDFMRAYHSFSSAVWDPPFDRALPPKVRALIAIVLFAYRGVEDTLPGHMRRALDLGASRQEIIEALEAAVLPGGAPVLYRGLKALMSLEEGGTA